ncbi:hypothetical protein IB274_07680 [Pseudomonas sp. PDM18]|uniref:hypothetical protein n=1 Tax=Pseudomonas sp. PDM18 TaxID=2769253 RepID=UPI00178321E5|nr:hypothetical protein [Pseudomonas sp. PDM18]MBD9676569.1 hypothetical protein [Pseudomonas sp. PDM18]
MSLRPAYRCSWSKTLRNALTLHHSVQIAAIQSAEWLRQIRAVYPESRETSPQLRKPID